MTLHSRCHTGGLGATNARLYGFHLQEGWINRIEGCRIYGNGAAGVLFQGNANGNEITDCDCSANRGHGVVVVSGSMVSIHRNVIEGNGGAGILAAGVTTLDITANYVRARSLVLALSLSNFSTPTTSGLTTPYRYSV